MVCARRFASVQYFFILTSCQNSIAACALYFDKLPKYCAQAACAQCFALVQYFFQELNWHLTKKMNVKVALTLISLYISGVSAFCIFITDRYFSRLFSDFDYPALWLWITYLIFLWFIWFSFIIVALYISCKKTDACRLFMICNYALILISVGIYISIPYPYYFGCATNLGILILLILSHGLHLIYKMCVRKGRFDYKAF